MKPIKLSRQSCMGVIWHYVTINKTSAEMLHDRQNFQNIYQTIYYILYTYLFTSFLIKTD